MKQWKVVVVLLALWLCIVLYMTNSVPSGLDSASRTERSLARAMEELDKLHQQNRELQELMAQLRDGQGFSHPPELQGDSAVQNLQSRLQKANSQLSELSDHSPNALTYQEEHARRKAENTARELWYFLESQMKKLEKNGGVEKSRIASLKHDLEGYRRTMIDDFESIRAANKAEEWRSQRSQELGDLVQRRLQYIQNPPDCKKAKKIVCNLHKGCGFGCQLHHVTYCLIASYAMERTLILESKGWRYSPKGWETVFAPLSETCLERGDGPKTAWGSSRAEMEKYQIIELPIIDSLHPRPDFMPLAVPADLSRELSVFHGDPGVWWIGQIIQYLFRLQPRVKADVEKAGNKMGFKNTIVGVHVRRTDKINLEAAYHSIEEYMDHVEEYFKQLERRQSGVVRRVYLASDDPKVLEEAKQKYPKYIFVSDNSISQSAGLGTRYSDSSLRGIIIDIYYLARCDYLVCTFSSQVCRVAYEIMQTLHGDASKSFRSLDDVFYYGGQNAHDLRAVEAQTANSDGVIDIKPGDGLGIAGNHWDGYSKGVNRRTGITGLFPSYKAEDTVVAVQMPTYPQVPLKRS